MSYSYLKPSIQSSLKKMPQLSRTEPVILRTDCYHGDRYAALFSSTYHDDNIIQSPLPGPIFTFWIRLADNCPLPDSVSLEIAGQHIVTTSSFVPVQGQEQRTYDIQFFRELPVLNQIFYHNIEIILHGPSSARYENAEIVVYGDTYNTTKEKQPEDIPTPKFIQTPGIFLEIHKFFTRTIRSMFWRAK